MKVAIIGAGTGGLAAIKHCLDEKVDCVAFEKSGEFGGIWNYHEETVDAMGLPLYSSMYAGLTTNLPKELMELEGFRYQTTIPSFITQREVLDYLHRYVKHFNLLPYIKFHHRVDCVAPHNNNKWTVQVKNLKTEETTTETFDGILVCNGHYFDPFYPSIEGQERFKGKTIHSSYYRTPDSYRGKRVLIVGGGPSGVDISRMVSQVAEKVFFSFRKAQVFGRSILDKSILKPGGIKRLEEQSVVFCDGSQEEIDEIIYCTGFNTIFPFLSEKCLISVEENWVKPLYKHIINIEHPTMGFVLLITHTCPFAMVGIQIRFFLAFLKGQFSMSKEEMYRDLKSDREARDKQGLSKKLAHVLGVNQLEYGEDLARIGGIKKLPPVLGKLFKYLIANNMPRDNYRIIDDEQFERIPIT